ncbi:heat shock protein 70 / HSP70 [Reticulomyxa filosa]|uniref:Heat shock protein 70 / HSP70 n=1 Tax=Reticulomyxa filosa TaxID=46433 RepID=X6LQB8_RETFI|nr:heat shock protein 70 / HSP70 [Reticulomyxa filosa]|eukprot:ETO03591.1 heat shock protein 70 / HSP70 [Reticulomyxa filosa]
MLIADRHLKENLNAEEAPAMGAAFRAANLSSAFRVRHIGMEDITSFPVGVRLKNLHPQTTEEKEFTKRGSLFSLNNHLSRRRAVALKHTQDLHATLFYEKEAPLPLDTNSDLGWFEVTGIKHAVQKYSLPDFNVTEPPKVGLSFLLDDSGLVDLVQATATFVEREITENKEKNDNNSTEGESKEEGEKDKEENKEAHDDPNGGVKELVTKERKHRVKLHVIRHPPNDVKWYDTKAFDASRKVLLELDDRDKSVLDTAQAQNMLETYIFESRMALQSDKYVEQVSTEETRTEVLDALSQAEEWVWEVTERSTEVFKKKLKELKQLGDPIFSRAKELEHRPNAVKQAGKIIHKLYESAEILKKNYTWIPINETEVLFNLTKSVEAWLNNQIESQSERSLTEDPVFSVKDIERRISIVQEMEQRLMARRPPPDFFKKKRQAKEKNANTTKSNDTSTTNDTLEDEPQSEDEQKDQENTFTSSTDANDAEKTNKNGDTDQTTDDPEKGEL